MEKRQLNVGKIRLFFLNTDFIIKHHTFLTKTTKLREIQI